jgi:parallel beta-helix repeat protein
VAVAATGFAASASADTINVHPGPNAIQNAIDGAASGDTLRVHPGRYEESVTVNEHALRIVGVGDSRPIIDGGCAAGAAVNVIRNDVRLEGLKVTGGSEYEVNFIGRASGRVIDSVVRDTCDALYGINVFNGGAVKVKDNIATGFRDAGIYVGGITNTRGGVLRLKNNESYGNNRGIIVEDSLRRTDIRVIGNSVHGNDLPGLGFRSGIFVHNGDGVLFRGNRANRNGRYGIHLDADSDHNRLFDNKAKRNGDRNFFNEGSGNCGSGNSFGLPHC